MVSSAFQSHAIPVTDHAAAVARVQARQAAELARPGFNPDLRSILLSHGRKTKQAVLLFHGYCVAPPYFKELAELCYQQGDNVYVPCAPHHGFQDRLTEEVSRLEAGELVRFADESVDTARGLGETLVVAGISLGGTLTAWAASVRGDISRAVVIEPFLGVRILPPWITPLALAAARHLPDVRIWWDPEKKAACDGEPYGYPRYSLRSIGQIGKIAWSVLTAARRSPPAAGKVVVVLNEGDRDVNNVLVQRLAERWIASGAPNVSLVRFPLAWGVPHDCLSRFQPKGNPPLILAELMKLIGTGHLE